MKRACRLALLQRGTWYRRSQANDQTPLRMRIRDIAYARPRFGYLRIQGPSREDMPGTSGLCRAKSIHFGRSPKSFA